MPISRFSNPFRKSARSDRIYDSDIPDTKGAQFFPQVLSEPNVGYVDDLNLPPLKMSSDFARKQRSQGTWQEEDYRGTDYGFLRSPEIRYKDTGMLQQQPASRNLARLRGVPAIGYENVGEFLNPIEAQNKQKDTLRERLKTWATNRPQQDVRRDVFNTLRDNVQNTKARNEALSRLGLSDSLRQRSNLNQAFSRMRDDMREARTLQARKQASLQTGATKLGSLADMLQDRFKQEAFNALQDNSQESNLKSILERGLARSNELKNAPKGLSTVLANKQPKEENIEAERIAMLPQLLQSKYKMGIANYIANHIRNPEDHRGLSYPSVSAIKMQELQNHILDEVNKQIPDNATDYLTNEYYNTIGANIYAQRTPNYQAMLKSQPSFQKAYDLKSFIDSIKNKILTSSQKFSK